MNERDDYYLCYKKLVRMNLQETIEKTREYKTFYENFPHLAESIRLQREKDKIKQELKSTKRRSGKLQQKRKMKAIEAKLGRENLLKRLHNEHKIEIRFNIRLKLDTSREYVSSLHNALLKGYRGIRSFDRVVSRFLNRKLPPVVSDLGSLDMTEKCLTVKEWIRRR